MPNLLTGLDEILRETRPDFYAILNPGLSDQEIEDTIQNSGEILKLPEEVKEWFKCVFSQFWQREVENFT